MAEEIYMETLDGIQKVFGINLSYFTIEANELFSLKLNLKSFLAFRNNQNVILTFSLKSLFGNRILALSYHTNRDGVLTICGKKKIYSRVPQPAMIASSTTSVEALTSDTFIVDTEINQEAMIVCEMTDGKVDEVVPMIVLNIEDEKSKFISVKTMTIIMLFLLFGVLVMLVETTRVNE